MTFLQKRPVFFTNAQKTLFFGLFWNFIFPFFSCFLFLFSNIKKTKQKVHIFFRKPFFDTLTNCQKIYFRTPTRYLCFFKIPKKHYKIGENKQKKNLGPSFDATLDQVLTQKNPKSWTKFWHYSIYIYIHTGCRNALLRLYSSLKWVLGS